MRQQQDYQPLPPDIQEINIQQTSPTSPSEDERIANILFKHPDVPPYSKFEILLPDQKEIDDKEIKPETIYFDLEDKVIYWTKNGQLNARRLEFSGEAFSDSSFTKVKDIQHIPKDSEEKTDEKILYVDLKKKQVIWCQGTEKVTATMLFKESIIPPLCQKIQKIEDDLNIQTYPFQMKILYFKLAEQIVCWMAGKKRISHHMSTGDSSIIRDYFESKPYNPSKSIDTTHVSWGNVLSILFGYYRLYKGKFDILVKINTKKLTALAEDEKEFLPPSYIDSLYKDVEKSIRYDWESEIDDIKRISGEISCLTSNCLLGIIFWSLFFSATTHLDSDDKHDQGVNEGYGAVGVLAAIVFNNCCLSPHEGLFSDLYSCFTTPRVNKNYSSFLEENSRQQRAVKAYLYPDFCSSLAPR
jgi:hypothetical protein